MKTKQIRQSILSAAIVAGVSVSAWYGLIRTDSSPATPVAANDSEKVPAAATIVTADAYYSGSATAAPVDVVLAPTLPGKRIVPKLANVTGRAIDLQGEAYLKSGRTGEKVRGRVSDVDPAALASLADVAEGDLVSIPTFDGDVQGIVEVALVDDAGWRRVGGPIEGDRSKGWFSFGYDGEHATGLVRMNTAKLAYQIEPAAGGRYQMVERPLADVVCMGLPAFEIPALAAPRRPAAVAAPVVTLIQNSRPGATAQLFMDFDGENVNDVEWGRINATASPLNATQRVNVFRRVKDDFLCFNINVTTDVGKYNAAKPGTRMRCIVTTVDTAAPGAGGVAYLNSFAYAGTIFTKDIPCWCFNPTVKSIADTISHEVGHTLGLNHDGLVGRAEYFDGQGTGATSWGPIMGAPFTKLVCQWSKGEYNGANNYEFDIEIIANSVNGFGYAPDDFGDTTATASPITFVNGNIEQRGVIDKPDDLDVFSFTTAHGGSVLVSASGIGNAVGNLDCQLETLNAYGVVVGTNKFDNSQGAGLNVLVGPGTSYLRIRGAGDGKVNGVGYSAYGSRGAYTITGRLPN